MYKAPLKEHIQSGSDFEQIVQAYEQGYESRRQGKHYVNPWKQTSVKYNGTEYPLKYNFGWEDDLNMRFSHGYYDWQPTDWVPYLTDEQQGDYALHPKTGKSRIKVDPKIGVPEKAWNHPDQRPIIIQ